ncbi:MAG: FAD-dependent oxidoreductase [Rhodospirillaceae bacterium]
MKAPKGDIAIIGGGILGVVLANEAIEAGFRPVVFRLSDQRVPFADSFRNQAWLQSGLRYVRHNPDLALRMWTYGRRLHEVIGVPKPTGRGLFQLRTADDVTAFLEDAKKLGILNEVEPVKPDEARKLLGPHHQSGAYVYSSPESPFDEAKLIRRGREQAERKVGGRNAIFCQIAQPVEIVPTPGKSPSHRLLIDGDEMEFGTTILAAGAGNIPLLKALGDQVEIKIQQTPLLVLPGDPTIRAPILVDRFDETSQYSVVAHPPGSCRVDGCMVFAADVHEPIGSYRLPSEREVDPKKRQALLDALPAPLKGRAHRFTAGWELAPVANGTALRTTEPFVDTARGHTDIVIAMPGRATLALYAAERVIERLKKRPAPDRDFKTVLRTQWDSSSIRMHHEDYYDQRLND